MKTISMPLEEYEAEIRKLKADLDLRSYKKGARELAEMIRNRVIHGRQDSYFKDQDLIDLIQGLVRDLEKDRIQRSITTQL